MKENHATSAIIGVLAAAATLLIGTTALAAADPAPPPPPGQDAHMPNSMMGYCPGGGFGGVGTGYCDGTKYPDGSYWHQVRIPAPFVGNTLNLDCVIDDGSPIPPPAPPPGSGR
jgi:hypothetical protein